MKPRHLPSNQFHQISDTYFEHEQDKDDTETEDAVARNQRESLSKACNCTKTQSVIEIVIQNATLFTNISEKDSKPSPTPELEKRRSLSNPLPQNTCNDDEPMVCKAFRKKLKENFVVQFCKKSKDLARLSCKNSCGFCDENKNRNVSASARHVLTESPQSQNNTGEIISSIE